MADFRRCFIVLASLSLLLGMAVTASAQTTAFQCTATAGVPPLVRSEGVTEKAGDAVLQCTGGSSTALGFNVPTANIQIFLNTSVTSRILDTTNNSTEALLTIDDQAPAGQILCGSINGADTTQAVGSGCNVPGKGAGAGSSYVAHTNTFRGQLAGSNSIVFLGVPIDPPGTVQGTRIIRITNIRANASALGVAGANAPPTPLIEVISASGSTSVPISNPQQTVGFVRQGLTTTVTGGGPFQQCFSQTNASAGSVTFTEGFATAFKYRAISNTGTPVVGAGAPTAQDVPGTIYESESAFYNPGFAAPYNIAGLADYSTRLKIVFSGVPAGITLKVPLTADNSTTNPPVPATLTVNLITTETGAYAAATSGTVALDSNGNGVAVYEVVLESPSFQESVTIPITASYTANPGANSPALGSAQGSGSFAPTSTAADWASASATYTIPRFINDGTLGLLFTVNKCATHLLFPFVTNEAGFDTGLAISNTSMDQYGTSVQHGTCDLFWYGANAPAKNTTPDIAAGSVWASTAMAMAPNFQGYVIADCQFQYAHGFAFVTRVGAVDIAMGYLALVIPDPPSPRSPNPFNCNNVGGTTAGCNAGSGEQLGM